MMNRCEKLGIGHAWENATPNIVYPTNPPQYPNRREKCLNCGLIRFRKEEHRSWFEYDRTEEKGGEK